MFKFIGNSVRRITTYKARIQNFHVGHITALDTLLFEIIITLPKIKAIYFDHL